MQLLRIFLTVGELGFERIRELGVLDRLLYPYYKQEKNAGKQDEEIKEYFLYFFERISAEKRYADKEDVCRRQVSNAVQNGFGIGQAYLLA